MFDDGSHELLRLLVLESKEKIPKTVVNISETKIDILSGRERLSRVATFSSWVSEETL